MCPRCCCGLARGGSSGLDHGDGDGNERTRSGMSESGNRHDEVPAANEAGWIRRLAAYCWRFKRDVVISLGGALIYTVMALLIPLLQRAIIDKVIISRTGSVWPLAIALAGAALAGFAGVYLRRYRGGKV